MERTTMEIKEFKVDGFILNARICNEPEVTDNPHILSAFDIFLEDDDCRLGIVIEINEGFKVFSDEDCRTYSKMQGAVRRAWELSNTDDVGSELVGWDEIQSQLSKLGIRI